MQDHHTEWQGVGVSMEEKAAATTDEISELDSKEHDSASFAHGSWFTVTWPSIDGVGQKPTIGFKGGFTGSFSTEAD